MINLLPEILYPIARRYITVDLRDLDRSFLIVNKLGEHINDYCEIFDTILFYQKMLSNFEFKHSAISIKPSQIGAPSSIFRKSLEQILFSRKLKQEPVVWIDMESSELTDFTINHYKSLLPSYSNLGICLQANLKRTISDIESLPPSSFIRLVKGAYQENSEIAYQSSKEIDLNFISCLQKMFEKFDRLAVATHDGTLINFTLEMMRYFPKTRVEFQRLKGVRVDINDPRYYSNLKTYVPFGKDWLPYFLRRIKERKRNLLLLFR